MLTTIGGVQRRRAARLAAGVAAALVLLSAGASARGDELEDLRSENARLRAEVEELRAKLAERDVRAPGDGASGQAVERVLVPSRVSLDVQPDPASGATRIATLWYRTVETPTLPRKEWFQVAALQSPAGTVQGPWLDVERHGGAGSLKAESGTLTVDGRAFPCAVDDYQTSRQDLAIGRGGASLRQEKLRCTLPPEALKAASGAQRAHFKAGAVDFELTDEHLAAFAALAARLQRTPQPAVARP